MILHVLFTGLVSDTSLSGGDQLIIDIAPRLPKDIKLVVITPDFAKKYWNGIDQQNIEFRYLKRNPFDLKNSLFLVFFSYIVRAWQVYFILRKEKNLEVIYSCSDVAYADIWPVFFLKGRSSKIKWLTRVYHVLLSPTQRQGNFLANFLAFYLQKLSFWMMKKKSDPILALNERLQGELLELDFPKDKTKILGAGIDFQMIHNFKPTKKYDYDIIALGRIAPVKGIYDIVKIWKIVHQDRSELKFAWIGGGPEVYQQKMIKLLKEKRLEDSFSMLGFIEKYEVYNILKSAKIFVCSDHENGWGLAICEAMSASLPVISYNIDIFGGVYKKGFRSVELFDTSAFAKEILAVLANPSLREKLSQDAQDQAKEFDHQQVINDLVGFLKV